MKRNGDWIETYSGKKFYPLDPRAEEVDILDIAHALAQLCRFGGHVKSFYSVSQHCVLVSEQVPEKYATWGLLHDASEAYLADICRPVKKDERFEFYREAERQLMQVITEHFGLQKDMPAEVKRADVVVGLTEARDLMPGAAAGWDVNAKPLPFTINPMTPGRAELYFLNRFVSLGGKWN